jgi:hypothetical protein
MLMMSQNRLAARDRLEAHNDDEINRRVEEEGGIAGLKSCATDEALRGHPESPPGTVLFFRLQSGAIPTGRLNARCLRKQLFVRTAARSAGEA